MMGGGWGGSGRKVSSFVSLVSPCFLATPNDPPVPEHTLPIHESPLCLRTPLPDVTSPLSFAQQTPIHPSIPRSKVKPFSTPPGSWLFPSPHLGIMATLPSYIPYSFTKICVLTFQLNGELLEDRGHFIPWAQPRPWFTAGTQHMVSCLDETLVLLSGVCFPELLAVTHPKVPHQQLHCSQREGFL